MSLQNGTHLIIREMRNRIFHVTIMCENELCAMFTTEPRFVNGLNTLTVTNVASPYCEVGSSEILSTIGALDTIITSCEYVLDKSFGFGDHTLVQCGWCDKILPWGFKDTPTFFECLRMEEVLMEEDHVYFEMIKGSVDNTTIFDMDGLQCAHEMFVISEDESLYTWN